MSHKLAKFFCVVVVMALALPSVPPANAAANYQINYQGKLTDSNGSALTSSLNMVFKLYTASSGGTAIWTETRSGANAVTVTEGLFSVLLGSVTALTAVSFDQTLYLGVTVGSDSEMTPRKQLGAVPAAFVADTIDGLTSAQFLRSDAANSTTTSSTFLTITQSGTGAIVDFQDGSNSALKILDGGNVGVGTSTPNWSLQVASSTPYFAITDTDAGSNAKHWLISNQGGFLQFGTSTDALNATSTYLTIDTAGRVGIATTTYSSTLTVNGSACISGVSGATAACSTTDGTISARTFNTATVDLAENYPTIDPNLTRGHIVAVDTVNHTHVKLASAGDVLLGVVSTAPGVLLGGAAPEQGEMEVPIALAGRIPVKVNIDNGPINVGDRIGLSNTSGIGARATTTSAVSVGLALQPYNSSEPGQIEVFVDLRGPTDPVVAMTQVANNFMIDENGRLVVKELQAERLCLGNTCIGEPELQEILRGRHLNPIPITPVIEPAPEVEPQPEPVPVPEPTPSPQPEPGPEPETPPIVSPEPETSPPPALPTSEPPSEAVAE